MMQRMLISFVVNRIVAKIIQYGESFNLQKVKEDWREKVEAMVPGVILDEWAVAAVDSVFQVLETILSVKMLSELIMLAIDKRYDDLLAAVVKLVKSAFPLK